MPEDTRRSANGFPIADAPPSADAASDARGPDLGGAARAVITPGRQVPELRRRARAAIGTDVPMVEVDRAGRITFVGGDWQSLTGHTKPGSLALGALLAGVADAEAVRRSIAGAMTEGTGAVYAHESRLGRRHLKVMPIPSPIVAGQRHALIGLSVDADVADLDDVAGVPSERFLVPEVVEHPSPGERVVRGEADPDPAGRSAVRPTGAESGTSTIDRWRSGQVVPAPIVAAAPIEDTVGATSAAERVERQPKRVPKWLLAVTAVASLFALQGLYLGPTYGWPSPLGPVLDTGECAVQPLCDNGVLRYNHLGVAALLVAAAGLILMMRRWGTAGPEGERPERIGAYGGDSWLATLEGSGLFGWLSIAALTLVVLQTVFGDAASPLPWLASIGFGAVAAWRADRDARRPLGATMGGLSLGVALLLAALGIGGLWLGERIVVSLGLIVVSVCFLVWSLRLLDAGRSTFDRLDVATMTGLMVLTLVLGLIRHRTWRYAFVGDEWTFFEGAMDGLRGNSTLATFDIGGPNDYFTGLTFELQGSVMWLGGADVWGWRLSALLPMVLSVPAMYAFTRWLAGRTAAIAAGVALAGSHMLLSFSMVPYNNSQSLVAVSASFAALAWAHQRPSAVRLFVLGAAVGSTFVVYAMARLALLPLGLLFLVLFRDELAALRRRLAWATLGGLTVAAPALFSWKNWEALLKATPVEAEANVRESGVVRQLLENTFGGWLSFIASDRNTHYVVGPHLDVLSAMLLVVGLAWAVVRARRDPAVRWFLIGGIGLWTAINAVQQYAQISNTRSFMIPLVYCVFVGLGVHACAPAIRSRLRATWAPAVLLVVFGLVIVGVNQWHISGHANGEQQLTEQAVLVREFEQTASVGGEGMPLYVAWPEERNQRLTMVLRAHDIAAERIVVVPTGGDMERDRLCATTDPVALVMHRNHPAVDDWRAHFEACWGRTAVEVTDPSGGLKLIRLTNDAGAAEFALEPGDRFRRGSPAADHDVRDVIDIAIGGDGTAYALVRSDAGGRIERLDGGGTFELAQDVPVDFDITPAGHFVVAGAGTDDRLVWYDGAGNLVARLSGRETLPTVGGVAVDGDLLWISDTARGRVVALRPDPGGVELVETRAGAGALIEPSALSPGPDGSIWVFSGAVGQIVRIDREDEAVTRIDAQAFAPFDVPRLTSTADGLLVRVIPERPEIQLVDADGVVLDERGGVSKPVAAAVRPGELVASDERWHEQPVLAVDERWAPDPARGVVAWDTQAPLPNGFVDYADPFAGAPVEAGPISTELAPAESVDLGSGRTWQELGVDVMTSTHALDVRGDVRIAVDTSGRAVRLDPDGSATEVIGVGSAASFVSDVVIDDSGRAWVLDAGAAQLHLLAPDGSVTTLQPEGAPLGNARGIGLASDGGVWVAATAAAGIARIGPDGSMIGMIGLPGRQPTDVVELADGSLWLVDGEQYAVVRIDATGAETAVLPLEQFSSAESPHLALGDDTLWVSAPEQSEVLAVDLAGAMMREFDGALQRPGGLRLDKAIGITILGDELWVIDSNAAAIATLDVG